MTVFALVSLICSLPFAVLRAMDREHWLPRFGHDLALYLKIETVLAATNAFFFFLMVVIW
jgi:hypothetical protein